MSQEIDLLLRAIKRAGSGRALAKLIDKPEQRISNWKNGIERIPDDALAEIAVYTNEDPIKVLATRSSTWARVANAMKEKISAGFEALLLWANPRQKLLLGR